MTLHDFIFSNDPRYRIARHVIFWLGWFVFSGIVQVSFTATIDKDPLTHVGGIIIFQLVRSLARFPGILMFCYFIIYFLSPRYFNRKHIIRFVLLFSFSVAALYLLTYGSLYFWLEMASINPYINHWPSWVYIFNSFYSNINFTGAIPTCGLMLAIKYYKDWYVTQRRREQLSRQNIQAELQLLKAQVHPHFLFNTLNNIYSFVLNRDNRAAGLVDKLAGMIEYMRTEGESPLVSLKKEIMLLQDYVGLERVRYGDRLDLSVEIHVPDDQKMIAPLLMIPFVENCFKHGVSVMRGKQWISLSIVLRDNELDFLLRNSKPADIPGKPNRRNIGLTNVRKRLQLLYPENHFLQTSSFADVYEVHLSITLEKTEILNAVEELPVHRQTAYVLNEVSL